MFFLNPPNKEFTILDTNQSNLKVINYPGFWKGLQYLPKFLRKCNLKKIYDRLEALAEAQFDIIWSFDNSVFYDYDLLYDHVFKISHIVDLNQDFQTKRAASTAHLCLGTTDLIVDRLNLFNSNTHKITHGFLFQDRKKSKAPLPGGGKIKALYAGNLAMPYMDWKIIYLATQKLNQVDFIFLGPNANEISYYGAESVSWKKKVIKSNNCHFPGRLNAEDLHAHYESSDVLLVAYQEKYHKDQANPHKMMEYLGSGTPIVATYTEEYAPLKSIAMSNSNDDWPELLSKVIDKLSNWNDESLREERIHYAINNAYDKQIDRIEEIINAK